MGTLHDNLFRDVVKRPDNDWPACQNEVLLGNELSASLHVGADNSLSCDVAEAQIFLESDRNNGVQSLEIEFEHWENGNYEECHRVTETQRSLRALRRQTNLEDDQSVESEPGFFLCFSCGRSEGCQEHAFSLPRCLCGEFQCCRNSLKTSGTLRVLYSR